MAVIDPLNLFGAKESYNWVKNTPPPRITKTHLSFDMLPQQLIDGKNKVRPVQGVRQSYVDSEM